MNILEVEIMRIAPELQDVSQERLQAKYLSAEIQDKQGNSKQIFRVLPVIRHHEIVCELENELSSGFQIEIQGGGQIIFRHKLKQIKIFDRSTLYGMADHRKTAEVLKPLFPDYQIIVENW